MSKGTLCPFHRHTLFPAQLKERKALSHNEEDRQIYHLSLDLTGSGICYRAGDALAIFPQNPPSMVKELLTTLASSDDAQSETIIDPWSNQPTSLHYLFSHRVNLLHASDALLNAMSLPCTPKFNQVGLYDLIDLFKQIHNPRSIFDNLLPHFSPLLPRFYSIASSQLETEGEAHLLVATFSYLRGHKYYRGIASDFLCHTAQVHHTPIPLYLHPAPHFSLPRDPQTPIIMVGAGTGLAPYRAFLQERERQGASGSHWLIFGERYSEHHYYYREFWVDLEKRGKLKISTAFSRDQPRKRYVQDCLLQESEELWKRLRDGAHLYICGHKKMAKEVLSSLDQVVQEQGGYSPEEAKVYRRELHRQGRLLTDLYG